MQALKALLIIMGVIIVGGFGFVGYEVYSRATNPDHPRSFAAKERRAAEAKAAAETAQATDPALPILAGSTLPPGARISQLTALGSRLAYHVTLPDGSEQVHILDTKDGKATIAVTAPAPAPAPATAPVR